MDDEQQYKLTQTVSALRCVAMSVAAAMEDEAISGQQVFDLITTIANQQSEIIKEKQQK